jgi:hypothetical protein
MKVLFVGDDDNPTIIAMFPDKRKRDSDFE